MILKTIAIIDAEYYFFFSVRIKTILLFNCYKIFNHENFFPHYNAA